MSIDKRICYVVGAMSLSPALCPHPGPSDYVIAADRGFDSLMAYGVTPDLAVGDFDSLGHAPNHHNVIQLPVEKDDTDMMAALRHGLDQGYRRFVLLGGVGGRLDHTVANLQLLDWLTTQGAQGVLAGEKTAATAIRNSALSFPTAMTGGLSVFCNSGLARGVCVSGAKYPLENADLTGSFPLGVSNQFIGEGVTVSVEEGCLLLLWEEKNDLYTLLSRLWVV